MKKIILTWVVLTMFILSSCANGNTTNSGGFSSTETVEYASLNSDWPVYKNAEELVERAELVFIGSVTGISFKMLDSVTGLPPDEDTEIDEWDPRLCTIYDVNIVTVYKGEPSAQTQVRVKGGLRDYRIEEQLAALAQYNQKYIPVMGEQFEIEIGETYLFALRQFETGTPTIMNPDQTSYNISNPFAKSTISRREFYKSAEYYNKNTDENGGPLISAKDVISYFGEDKWDDFWSKWQEDNPDWETRLDKAAVEKALAKE